MQSVYTIEGDAWSYGVLLSEICSRGNNPYVQFRSLSTDFIQHLEGGGKCSCHAGAFVHICSRRSLPRMSFLVPQAGHNFLSHFAAAVSSTCPLYPPPLSRALCLLR